MKLSEKFGIYGIDDERSRRTLFPSRIVLTRGKVSGQMHLAEYKPVQVAIYGYHDQCLLDNRECGENACGQNACILVDFGRELHGSLCLSLWNVSGQVKFRIRLGESVSEALSDIGVKGATNDHACRDLEMASGAWSSNETNESGFRFAYVELVTPGAFAEIRSVTATLIFRDIEYMGRFESSDTLLNKIYDTAAYTVHLNMQRYLWDGIKRDRLVWAGDMYTEVSSILAVFGENAVVPKSLDFIRDVTPAGESMNSISSYNLWWIMCQYRWFMGTADYGYLVSQKEYIKETLTRYLGYIDEGGSEILPEGRFMDWQTNGDGWAKHCGLQGLLRRALYEGGRIMALLGESEFAGDCFMAWEKMASHKPDPGKWKQPAALLVSGGLLEAEKAYNDCISVGGARGLSTFLGYFTLSAAAKAGKYAEALDLMRDYWGGMLKMGATTFWEDFDVDWMDNAAPIDDVVPEGKRDIHGDFGAYCYTGLRHSLCHGWASGPVPYLAENVLGIVPLEPGYTKFRFEPHTDGLEWVKGAVPTPYGVIGVEIEKDKKRITVPHGVEVCKQH